MNLARVSTTAERLDLPDAFLRNSVVTAATSTARNLMPAANGDDDFATWMARQPIGRHCSIALPMHGANPQAQLPAAFFKFVLGPSRSCSSALFHAANQSLAAAETQAQAATCDMATVADGQRILELGCGWGALTLYMARTYPAADITAIASSIAQRDFIAREAMIRGLRNVRVFVTDMNDFAPGTRFDRVVSVDMFAHVANWRALLTRVRSWLAPGGRAFVQVCTHATTSYAVESQHAADRITQHFFTGGIVPSRRLIQQFQDVFAVESEQYWQGTHYQRTAQLWLNNFDRNHAQVAQILRDAYGLDAELWHRRWRLFFLSMAGFFGFAGGEIWSVAQYRLRPACVKG